MKTRTIPGPLGPFLIPAEPEATSMHAERCCRSVFDGEYSYPREAPEGIRTVLDVGANCGAFAAWAWSWWPGLELVTAYEPNRDAAELCEQNGKGAAWCLSVYPLAVTTREGASLSLDDNWGARRLVDHDRRNAIAVATIHPRELPAADVLKVDVEGGGAEVFALYRYWGGVRIAMYESHSAQERDVMAAICEQEGLRMVRGNPENPESDVRVWTR